MRRPSLLTTLLLMFGGSEASFAALNVSGSFTDAKRLGARA
jgi:hypothetical protein